MHKFPLMIVAAMALSSAPAATAAASSVTSQQASSPQAAAAAFVDAFNALDRSRFDPLFADDVTLFFPSAPFEVRRVDGKADVLLWFGRFFDSAKKSGQGKLNIVPRDLQVQDYGDVAIATFHLGNDETVGRRTLVLRRKGQNWQIVHLHASSQPLKKKS